jgi:hypothetical protein
LPLFHVNSMQNEISLFKREGVQHVSNSRSVENLEKSTYTETCVIYRNKMLLKRFNLFFRCFPKKTKNKEKVGGSLVFWGSAAWHSAWACL